jgi:hypothetical protein
MGSTEYLENFDGGKMAHILFQLSENAFGHFDKIC